VAITVPAIISVSTGLELPCLSSKKPPTILYLPSYYRRSPTLPPATRAQSSSENAAPPRTPPTSSTSHVGELPPSQPCSVGSHVTMDARAPPFSSHLPACAAANHGTPGARRAPSRVAVGLSGVCETRLSHSVVHVGLGHNWPVRLFKSFSFILNCLNIFKGFSLIQIS
jgi:hypothetical protein